MKATPEYKEEFLNRFYEIDKFRQSIVCEKGLEVETIQILLENLDIQKGVEYDYSQGPDRRFYFLFEDCQEEKDYLKQTIHRKAKEVLTWFEEDEELQVFEDKGQKFTAEEFIRCNDLKSKEMESLAEKENGIIVNERALKEGHETLKKYEMKDKDRKFTASDIYHGSNKKFEDILKKTLEKKENKMTYAEQQYKKIEELENTLKLQYPFSIDRNPTTGEIFFRVVDTKALSKEEALKLANNIIKLLSPLESGE